MTSLEVRSIACLKRMKVPPQHLPSQAVYGVRRTTFGRLGKEVSNQNGVLCISDRSNISFYTSYFKTVTR